MNIGIYFLKAPGRGQSNSDREVLLYKNCFLIIQI